MFQISYVYHRMNCDIIFAACMCLKLTSWYFAWQHAAVFSILELNAKM